jgi:hypothetical protein
MEWFKRSSKQPVTNIEKKRESVEDTIDKTLTDSSLNKNALSGGPSSENSVSVDIDAKYAQLEFDAKIDDLTESLEEKAKENMALVAQQNILKERIKELEEKIKKEEEYNSIQSTATQTSEATNKEYRRRFDTMTESLIIQARENVELRENIYAAKVKVAYSEATEVAIKLIKENKGENEMVVLKAECMRLRQREDSYHEAVEGTYEVNIREISRKTQSSLAKEQERRKKAELDVQKLVQQILKLESQLAEKGEEKEESTSL